MRKKFELCVSVRKKNLVESEKNLSYQSPLSKTEDQKMYPTYKIRAISRINKTTSTLFQNQKGLTVGVCHDVLHSSYDNHLYNRTKLNQSIESLNQNRKETTYSALFQRKFSKSLILV